MTWPGGRIEVFDPSRRNRPGKIRRTTLELRCWISTPAKWLRHSNPPIPPFRSHRVYLRSMDRNIFELPETIRFALSHFFQPSFVPRGSTHRLSLYSNPPSPTPP